jgi:hypothetical protein
LRDEMIVTEYPRKLASAWRRPTEQEGQA